MIKFRWLGLLLVVLLSMFFVKVIYIQHGIWYRSPSAVISRITNIDIPSSHIDVIYSEVHEKRILYSVIYILKLEDGFRSDISEYCILSQFGEADFLQLFSHYIVRASVFDFDSQLEVCVIPSPGGWWDVYYYGGYLIFSYGSYHNYGYREIPAKEPMQE